MSFIVIQGVSLVVAWPKMLVGAKSWQDADFPDYGRFSSHRRKDITYQIDILLQQGLLTLDGQAHLVPSS